jgi:ubiquinone/menaquinone biosynthesis C-methylase UbiE
MSTEFIRQVAAPDVELASLSRGDVLDAIGRGIKRRWLRERRRRKVARAYDMALEIARVIPHGAQVLDVGCGNGFIAHHLSAMLGVSAVGIDLMPETEAPIRYRRYDGAHVPLPDDSVDAVLLCYVLHHVQDVPALLSDITRVLRPNGFAVIYEDIPETLWDLFVCWTHDLQWRRRAGACTFRNVRGWRAIFDEAGFEIIRERQLSRLRNLTHTVCRRFYLLRATTAINARAARSADPHNRPSVLMSKGNELPSYSSPAS